MRKIDNKGLTLLEIVTTMGAVILLSTFSFKLFNHSVQRYAREDKARKSNLNMKELLTDLDEDLRKVRVGVQAKTFETAGVFERDGFQCTHKSPPSVCRNGLEIPQITLVNDEGRTENGRKASVARESKVVYLTECANSPKDSEKKRKPIHDKLFCTSGRSKLYRRFYPDARDDKYVQKTYEDAEGFGALCIRDCNFFVTELGHSKRNAAGVVQIKQENHYFFRRPVKSPGNIIR